VKLAKDKSLFSKITKKIVRIFLFPNIIKVYMIKTISLLEGVDNNQADKKPVHSVTLCLPFFHL
jgi:hypothetical protein